MAKPLNVNSEMQPMKSTGMVVLAGLGPCVVAGTAGATVFQIDGFSVTENGQTYWLDDFSDGAAPLACGVQDPASVDQHLYNRAYLTSPLPGLLGPQAGGKLALDTARGNLNIGAVTPVLNLIQRPRANLFTNSALAGALTASDAIVVFATL